MSDHMPNLPTTLSERYEFNFEQDSIDVTSDRPSLDPHWRGTDGNGHEHYRDRDRHTYPTLDHIIDEQHWCEGDEGMAPHDPHMHVDEDHYECKICREHVQPGIIPAGARRSIPGSWSATLKGPTSRPGVIVEVSLEADELERLAEHGDVAAADILNRAAETMERVTLMEMRGS